MKYALIIITLLAFVTITSAGMPKELKGSWIVNAVESEKNMKTSPKWRDEDAKYLPTVMKRMSQVSYTFDEGVITATMGDRKMPLKVVLKKHEKQTFVFEGTVKDKAITLTVSLDKQGNMNIKSSMTDDMDYYIWNKGKVTAKKKDDKDLASEVMKKALESHSDTSAPVKAK